MKLSRTQLLSDLHQAYLDARRHKRNKPYQLHFEASADYYLEDLCNSLLRKTYRPYASECFVIREPKCREVFAAHFRDRVVHHLYYNYTHEIFERTFIQDAYSCIKGRGTHYGIDRLRRHIMQESRNYTCECYVLKMDIRGYFMNINRQHLANIAVESLKKMSGHKVGKYRPECWNDVVDLDFLCYLTREIALLNPMEHCRYIGSPSDWEDLPHEKTLFHSPDGCGLPIGNLTSQLFSNVYLNIFDQFMKRSLHCRHYGRYVDDFYVVSKDRQWLASLVPQVKVFLADNLGLCIHEGKTQILSVKKGIEYLGAYVLPYRIYVGRSTLFRIYNKLPVLEMENRRDLVASSLNSYCGIFSHGRNFNLRKRLLLEAYNFTDCGCFDYGVRHFKTNRKNIGANPIGQVDS